MAPTIELDAPNTFSMAWRPPTSRYASRVCAMSAPSRASPRIFEVEYALHGGDPSVKKAPVAFFSRRNSMGLHESPTEKLSYPKRRR